MAAPRPSSPPRNQGLCVEPGSESDVPVAQNNNGCPSSLGNFSGIALVNGIGPFAFQRLFHDDSDRFTAALAATPMKQYWEYSQNKSFLAECYSWVRDSAEFYASYARMNPHTGVLDIPYSCGEEGCRLRNPKCCPHAVQPDQTKNSMADLALAGATHSVGESCAARDLGCRCSCCAVEGANNSGRKKYVFIGVLRGYR